MKEWVDPDFYTTQTLTDIILCQSNPLSSSQKQLFAATLSRAITNPAPPVAAALKEMLQTLENATVSAIGDQCTKSVDANLLHRLPAELILDVAELLEPTDFLSFRASCKWAYRVVQPLSTGILRDTILAEGSTMDFSRYTTWETLRLLLVRDDIALRFHRDRFGRLASSEILTQILYGKQASKALCGFCLDLHAVSAFSPAELAKSPYERKCVGAMANFRLCEHKHVSLHDIINLRQQGQRVVGFQNPQRTLLCTKGCCHQYPLFTQHNAGSGGRDTLTLVQDYKVAPPHTLTQQARASTGQETRGLFDVTLWEIRGILMKLDEYICPHMRTSSPEAFRALVDKLLAAVFLE